MEAEKEVSRYHLFAQSPICGHNEKALVPGSICGKRQTQCTVIRSCSTTTNIHRRVELFKFTPVRAAWLLHRCPWKNQLPWTESGSAAPQCQIGNPWAKDSKNIFHEKLTSITWGIKRIKTLRLKREMKQSKVGKFSTCCERRWQWPWNNLKPRAGSRCNSDPRPKTWGCSGLDSAPAAALQPHNPADEPKGSRVSG